MNRNSKTNVIPKPKTVSKQTTPKSIDKINLLYDDEFITLINGLNGLIKSLNKSNNTLFLNMKNLITTHQPYQNIQNTFGLIDRSFVEFYSNAKEYFIKMKASRNGNLIKLTSEQGQPFKSIRCNTLISMENAPSPKSDKVLDYQQKYEQIKNENSLLKKRMDELETKNKSIRTTSHSKALISGEPNKKTEMTEFASAVNRFINTISNVQEKNTSSIGPNSSLNDTNSNTKSDRLLLQTFDQDKLEINTKCKNTNVSNDDQYSPVNSSITPSSKKSVQIGTYSFPNQESQQDFKLVIKKMKVEINNYKKTVDSIKKENDQLKTDCTHLNNLHIIEINKTKSLTEQLLKFESESALYNKERTILNDKYIKLLEENDALSISLNSQCSQIQKKSMSNNHTIEGLRETISILTKANEEMKIEIEQLNNKLILTLSKNKRDNEGMETTKIKNAETQLTILNKKNMELALKITEIAKEKIKIHQTLIDKENDVNNLNIKIMELSDQAQKRIVDIERLSQSIVLEQKKNISLMKENEDISSKMKEFFNEIMKQAKENKQIDETNGSQFKQTTIYSSKKDKEMNATINDTLLKEDNIKILRENILSLIYKQKDPNGFDKEIARQKEQHVNKVFELENQLKELNFQLRESEGNYSVIMVNHIDEMAKARNVVEMLTKENKELTSTVKENQNKIKENMQLMNEKTSEANNKIKALTDDLINQKKAVETATLLFLSKEKIIEEKDKISQKLNEEMKGLKGKVDQLESNIKASMKEKENHKAEIVKYQEQCNLNKSTITKLNEEKEKLASDSQAQLKIEVQKLNKANSMIQLHDKEMKEMKDMVQKLIQENIKNIEEYEDKISGQASEKSQLIETIKNHLDTITSKDKEITSLKNTITEHEKEIEVSSKRLATTSNEINSLKETNEQSQNEKKVYDSFVEEINQKINNLLEKVDSKDKIIKLREETILLNQEEKEKLYCTIKSKEALICTLQEYLNKNEQSTKTHGTKLNEKDELIDELNKKSQLLSIKLQETTDLLQEKEKELPKLVQFLKEKEDEILSLQNNLKNKEDNALAMNQKNAQEHNEKLLSTTKSLKESEAVIINLKQSLSDKNTEITSLRKESKNKEDELQEAIMSVQAKDKLIQTQNEKLKNNEDEINQIKKTLMEKEQELNITLEDLSNTKAIIDSIQNNMSNQEKESKTLKNETLKLKEEKIKELADLNSKMEEEVNSYKLDLIRKDEEIQCNQDSLLKKDKSIEELNGVIKSKEKEFKKVNDLMIQLKSEVSDLKKDKITQENKIKELVKSIESHEDTISSLEDDLKLKDKEIRTNNDSLNLYKTKQTVLKKNFSEKESDLINEIEEKDTENKKNQTQIKELQKEKSELNDQLTQSKKKQETLQQSLKKSNDELTKLKDKYDEEQTEIKEVISVLRKDKESSRVEILHLKEELKAFGENEYNAQKDNKIMRTQSINQITQLKREIEEHLETIEEQRAQLESFAEESNEMKSKALKDSEEINDLNSQIKQQEKEIEELNNQLEKIESKIKELNLQIDELSQENTDLTHQLKDVNKQKDELNKQLQKKANTNKELNEKRDSNDKEIRDLNAQITKNSKETKELRQQIKQLSNEAKELREQSDDYLREIKDAIALLSKKFSISLKGNGIEPSLIELIEEIESIQINNKNEDKESEIQEEEEEEEYLPDKYNLITIKKISSGLQWYLLKTKSSPTKCKNDSYKHYCWVKSDDIDIKEFNEPTDKNINDTTALENEIRALQKYQDELIDQLAKRESDYRKLNLQVAKIINKQKTEDLSQEKRVSQKVDQLKEENKKLQCELQEIKMIYNIEGTNKNLGVSFINDQNNISNFIDDSNVEEILHEMTYKRPSGTFGYQNSSGNQVSQIKVLFDKLLSEIPLTLPVKSTIASILKQFQLPNEEISQILNKFRSGVITLPNNKIPRSNN